MSKQFGFLLVVVFIFFGVVMVQRENNKDNDLDIFKTTVVDDQFEISEDKYVYAGFTLDETKKVTIDVENLTSNGFEVFVFDEDNYAKYQQGESCSGQSYNIPGSYETTKTLNLPKGRYYVVVDNSDFGEVIPPMNFSDDVIILNLEVTYK